MKTLCRLSVSCLMVAGVLSASASDEPGVIVLPDSCNTPDGCTVTDDGDIILSMPNFNNGALMESKAIKEPAPAHMVKIDKQNKVTKWYEFKKEDMHAETGKIGPMGCDVGPDGHLYVADMQLFFDGNNKSRLLRITIEDGKAVRCDTVVEGFIGRVKCRLGYGRLTWQGLENVGIHVSIVLCVVYAVAIAASRIGRPELRQSVAFFA